MTDLSLRETAARALWEHDHWHPAPAFSTGDPYVDDSYYCRGEDVLAAVAAHDGLAEVLSEHGGVQWDEDDGVWSWRCSCDAVLFGSEGAPAFLTVPGVKFLTLAHAAHLADVVRAWLLT